MSWGRILEDISLKLLVKQAERGDGSHGSDQISWAQLLAALLPPCALGEGSAITLCCIFAACLVGTIVLSIWEEKLPQGSGSRRLLLGAAVQPWSTCRGSKQSWGIVTCHLLHTRCAGSAPPSHSLVQVPSACGDPFQCLPLLARMWDQIWPHDNQEGKLVAWAE